MNRYYPAGVIFHNTILGLPPGGRPGTPSGTCTWRTWTRSSPPPGPSSPSHSFNGVSSPTTSRMSVVATWLYTSRY